MITIADSLAAAIKERGLTQADVAKELNVSQSWVNQRLTGVRGSVEDLEAIAEKAGLTPVWREAEPVTEGEGHWYESALLNPKAQQRDDGLSADGAQS